MTEKVFHVLYLSPPTQVSNTIFLASHAIIFLSRVKIAIQSISLEIKISRLVLTKTDKIFIIRDTTHN